MKEQPCSTSPMDQEELIRMNELGMRYHQQMRFDRSLEQFWLSLLRAREMGSRQWEVAALNNIGMVYQSWGRFDHSLKFYRQALRIAMAIDFHRGKVVALNNMGSLFEAWGRYERAVEHYEEGLRWADQMPEQGNARRVTLLNLVFCLEKLGQYDRCRELMEEVLALDKALNHPNTCTDEAYMERLRDLP